jgi:hypothetical protein
MDISITRRIAVLRMGTTGRIGLWTAYLSESDRGSTALRVSMAMWITASIRTMRYEGPMPVRGSEAFNHFQANEARDGHGHVVATPSHAGAEEHALPGFRGGGRR